MNRRLLAAVAAAALAVLGVVLLISYAGQAEQRAFEGAELVSALRVIKDVPEGADADAVEQAVESVELPRTAVPDDALTDLADIGSRQTLTAMVPGDLLLDGRLGDAEDVGASEDGVPEGMHEVSIPLNGPRSAQEKLEIGSRVSIYASYDTDSEDPAATRMLEASVLVTGTSETVLDAQPGVVVTLAVDTETAERVIHAMEFGKVWLGLENDATKTGGSSTVTRKDNVR